MFHVSYVSDTRPERKPCELTEDVMNCRNCNTGIDYNYVTNCPHCGCKVEGGDLPQPDPSLDFGRKKHVWSYRLANLVYVLFAAATGMVSGAVMLYFSFAVAYIALRSPETSPGQHCAEGMALGMLSVLLGGFLGTVGGTAFSLEHLKRFSKTLV
jgi:hypothetical protein